LQFFSPDNGTSPARDFMEHRQVQDELAWKRDRRGEPEPRAACRDVKHRARPDHRTVVVHHQCRLKHFSARSLSMFYTHRTVPIRPVLDRLAAQERGVVCRTLEELEYATRSSVIPGENQHVRRSFPVLRRVPKPRRVISRLGYSDFYLYFISILLLGPYDAASFKIKYSLSAEQYGGSTA
jgi:hypothetical protein